LFSRDFRAHLEKMDSAAHQHQVDLTVPMSNSFRDETLRERAEKPGDPVVLVWLETLR
jgi:hypothetical protein